MADQLIHVRVESSLLPPFEVGAGDVGATRQSGVAGALLTLVRPRITLSSALFKNATVTEPYGSPFPWPLGLALLVVVLFFLGGLVGTLVHRIVR